MATPTLDRPAPSPDNSKNRKFLEGPKKVIAILLGTGALGLAGYQALDRDMTGTVHDIADNAKSQYDDKMADRGYDVTNGDPVKIDVPPKSENGMENIAVQYPTTIVAQGEMSDMLGEYNKFEENRQATLDSLIAGGNLSAEQLSFLQENLASMASKTNKADYTDNEVLAAVSLDLALTSRQGANYGYGADMLPMIYSKANSDYASVESTVTRHDSDDVVLDRVWRQNGDPYLRPEDHYFNGDDFGQVKDARVIVRNKIRGNGQEVTPLETVITVFVLNDDGNGNEMWQQFKNYSWDDESAREALHNLHPQNQGR